MSAAPFFIAAQDGAALPRWLLDLLSVDTSRLEGGTEHFRLARFPEGGWGLLALLLLAAGCAAFFWIYRHEGQLARWKKLSLAAVRCLVLLLAAFVLSYPVLEVDRKQTLRASTVLLVDASLSQGIRDAYRSDTARRDATALALGMQPRDVASATRSELVTRALASPELRILSRLAASNQLKAYAFSGLPLEPLRLEEVPLAGRGAPGSPPGDTIAPAAAPGTPPATAGPRGVRLPEVPPKGAITDIAGAVLTAVEEQGASRIAGIVLITDGRVTAGDDLKGVAAALARAGIPVHPVGVGDPTPTRNYRVTAVLASERVFTGDPVVVDVRLQQHGFDGETVRVELLDAYEPEGEPPHAPVQVAASDASFAEGRADTTASFRFEPDGTGRHRLTARIEVRKEETFSDDNERSVSMEVLKEASEVLLVSGGPSYEYRFLKDLLRRDSRIFLAAWLMSADPDFPQEGNVSLKKIPSTPKELFAYDVVILMDVDPRGLPPDWGKLLEDFVGKHKGGLVYVAGDKFSADFLSAPSMAPVRNLLPVVVDPAVLQDELERGRYYEKQWPLDPTPAALEHAATRLSSQIDRNRQRWAEITGIYWSFPVLKAKPGATVLFEHPDPVLVRDGTPRPLVATQFYEGGRVAWCGIDSTWRWRAAAMEVYDRYWIQLIRFLTEGRLLGDRRQILQTDAESYELGDTIRVSLLMEDENYRPVEAEEVKVLIEDPEGAVIELSLAKDPYSPGWFRASYTPRVLGRLKLRLPNGPERVVTVEPPALEFAVPRLDEESLRELAATTHGKYRTLADIAGLPEEIPDLRQTVVTTDDPIALWDNWLVLGCLAGLLTLEWILRKLNRLL